MQIVVSRPHRIRLNPPTGAHCYPNLHLFSCIYSNTSFNCSEHNNGFQHSLPILSTSCPTGGTMWCPITNQHYLLIHLPQSWWMSAKEIYHHYPNNLDGPSREPTWPFAKKERPLTGNTPPSNYFSSRQWLSKLHRSLGKWPVANRLWHIQRQKANAKDESTVTFAPSYHSSNYVVLNEMHSNPCISPYTKRGNITIISTNIDWMMKQSR